jgi:hypothetical protein
MLGEGRKCQPYRARSVELEEKQKQPDKGLKDPLSIQ